MNFSNAKAVVTGATRGIGRAVTLALLAEGAEVYGLFGGNQEAAGALREEAAQRGAGGRLRLRQLDVADFPAIADFFGQLEAEWERLDMLVNCAGIRRDAVMPMMKHADWQRVLDVNLSGCFNTSKAALPLMLRQKYGRIVFITSPMGHLLSGVSGNFRKFFSSGKHIDKGRLSYIRSSRKGQFFFIV